MIKTVDLATRISGTGSTGTGIIYITAWLIEAINSLADTALKFCVQYKNNKEPLSS